MCVGKKIGFVWFLGMALLVACTNPNTEREKDKPLVLKGLYSFGPEIKSFIDCEEGKEYWVADSAKALELEYHSLGFEKPYVPVYIEVECYLTKSDTTTITGGFDSTMVVTKVLKLSKQIPEGSCYQ